MDRVAGAEVEYLPGDPHGLRPVAHQPPLQAPALLVVTGFVDPLFRHEIPIRQGIHVRQDVAVKRGAEPAGVVVGALDDFPIFPAVHPEQQAGPRTGDMGETPEERGRLVGLEVADGGPGRENSDPATWAATG